MEMLGLDENWIPNWGEIVTWFGMDKYGKIAIMINNGWGDLPKVILKQPNIDGCLGEIFKIIYEESEIYQNYSKKMETLS